MQPLLRRLVVLLVALAFLAGGVIGAAVPNAAAAEPCTQGHGHADHQAGAHEHGKKSDHDKNHQAPASSAAVWASAPRPRISPVL